MQTQTCPKGFIYGGVKCAGHGSLVGKPDEDEYRKALSSVVSCEGSTTISGKGVISAPLVSMDASFKSIVVSLNLIDEGREPLVLRSDWNPEASHSDKYFPDYFR